MNQQICNRECDFYPLLIVIFLLVAILVAEIQRLRNTQSKILKKPVFTDDFNLNQIRSRIQLDRLYSVITNLDSDSSDDDEPDVIKIELMKSE